MAISNEAEYIEFWDENRMELLRRLYMSGVPVYGDTLGSQWGINLCQVRCRGKYGQGKLHTKWLNLQSLKKKQRPVNQCIWTLYPMQIKPRKQSVDFKDCMYCFFLDVQKWDFQTNIRSCCRTEIEASWDGTLLRQKVCRGEKDKQFPAKFAFPKRLITKINRCLYNNFFLELWNGPQYAIWHRTDEGMPAYLKTHGSTEKISEEQLVSFLKSPFGDVGVVLLAYTCFAVLKSFFPQYRSLNANTPYMKAKKYIPEQLAVNIRSDRSEVAENLVKSFCDCFQTEGQTRVPVIDGVAVQRIPKKQTFLGINEFEATVLQPACALWVNRIPAKELIESGQILDLYLTAETEAPQICAMGLGVVTALADNIHNISLASFKSLRQHNWNSVVPMIEQLQNDFLEAADKYNFVFDEAEYALQKPTIAKEDSIPLDPEKYVTTLFHWVNADVGYDLYDVTSENVGRLLKLQEELKSIYLKCRREIRKCTARNRVEKFSLHPLYEDEMKHFSSDKIFQKMPIHVQQKAAYLSAALDFWTRMNLSPDCYSWIIGKLEKSLASSFSQNLKSTWASEVLEKYIANVIQRGRCARIVGEGSDQPNICLWYDPREELFLLPSKTYYAALQPMLAGRAVTKEIFERRLVDERTIHIARRKNQDRRTFEIKVVQGAARRSVLKVNLQNFSEKFFADQKIQQQLQLMSSDGTSYRTRSNPM